jgi:hypothetical protein
MTRASSAIEPLYDDPVELPPQCSREQLLAFGRKAPIRFKPTLMTLVEDPESQSGSVLWNRPDFPCI